MTDARAIRLQTALAGASALPRPERAAYLDSACAGDAALRAEVEALLKSHDAAGRFLSAPTVDPFQEPARPRDVRAHRSAPDQDTEDSPNP